MADPATESEKTPAASLVGESVDEPLLTGAVRRQVRQTFRALRHRNFRLFLGGQVVSLVGTWMQSTAQSWLVYRLTHSELLLGTAWFCTQIPVFALGPLGGLAADRFSRHRIVLRTQTLSMLQAAALAALTLTGVVTVGHVLALAAMLGCINAFDMPGRNSLLIEMTGKEDLLNAVSLNSTTFNLARVAGPAVAGFLVAAIGEGLCFALNAVSFLAAIAALLAMRLPPRRIERTKDSPWAHLVEGFRYAWRHQPVRRVLLAMAATTMGGMPVLVLMPFFADDMFHRGAKGLGVLMAAMGVGAVIGVLGLAARTEFRGLARVLAGSAAMLGLAFVAFSQSRSFALSVAIIALVGFNVMRQMASANTMLQTMIPDEFRGRIMALYSMTVVGLGPFGSLAAGALAHAAGARVAVLSGGLICIAGAAMFHRYASNGAYD